MPRQPKPKNTLSAGQRALLYEQELKKRAAALSGDAYDGTALGGSGEHPASEPAGGDGTAGHTDRSPLRATVKKPKPSVAGIRVDMSDAGSLPCVPYGICGAPIGESADVTGLIRGAHIPYIRLGGRAPMRSSNSLNIFEIFRDPDADESLEASYGFGRADRYVLAAYGTGARVIFGLCICPDENASEGVLRLMRDRGRLVRICVNIIRHYNDRWCKGYALGIGMVEIICPDEVCQSAHGLTAAEVFEAYVRISDGIKLYDRELSVGGICFDDPSRAYRDFLRYISSSNAALDFLSISVRARSPEHLCEQIEQYARVLRTSKYAGAGIAVVEWEYIPSIDGTERPEAVMSSVSPELAEQRKELYLKQRSVFGAAFAASSLIRLLSMPEVSHACMLCGEAGDARCAVFDRFGIAEKPYYALEAFGRLASEPLWMACADMQDPRYSHSGVYAAAARGDSEAYVMLSAFDGVTSIDLRLTNIPDGFYTADIYMLDGVKSMELCNSIQLAGMSKRMVLSVSPYSVVLIKLY